MIFGNILNFSTTILAVSLLFNKFYTFIYIKPTQTSLAQSSMKKEYFPAVIVCPEPAFNMTALKEEDYRILYNLWTALRLAFFMGYELWKVVQWFLYLI